MTILITLFLPLKTQDYMFLTSLYQQKAIKNYQNFLENNFKDQCIGINVKRKVRIKVGQMSINTFSNQIVGVNTLFVLIYSNQDNDSKRYKAEDIIKRYY